MSSYLSTIYNEKKIPFTDYPSKLIKYLVEVFDLKSGMKVLEPGCGRSEFIKNFRNHGLSIYGLDISNEALDFADDFEIKICNIENEAMPYPDNYFDVIYSKSFIEHLHDPGVFFKESFRILKPGGLLISIAPDWEANWRAYFDDMTHRTPITTISLKDAYDIYGFEKTSVNIFRQLPIVWKYPILNHFCYFISLFYSIRSPLMKIKIFRFSKQLMVFGYGYKPKK